MASTASKETVALALHELYMTPADQDGLADFLTEYFGSHETDDLCYSNKYSLKIHAAAVNTESDDELEALESTEDPSNNSSHTY